VARQSGIPRAVIFGQMADNILVLPGTAGIDLSVLESAARDFGCIVEVVRDTAEAAALRAARHTVGLLFHRDAVGSDCSWIEAIRRLKVALPEVRLVACHGFSEAVEWEELGEAGAFHSLVLPLKENEVRQSIGFLREAESRPGERNPSPPVHSTGSINLNPANLLTNTLVAAAAVMRISAAPTQEWGPKPSERCAGPRRARSKQSGFEN